MKYLKFILFLLLLQVSISVNGQNDTLEIKKYIYQFSIYDGLNLSRNQITNSYDNRNLFGSNFYFQKNKVHLGFDFQTTGFKTKDWRTEFVGSWIQRRLTYKVNIFSFNVGKSFTKKQKIKLTAGLGVLTLKTPNIEYHDGFLSSYYYIKNYSKSYSLCTNLSCKIMLNEKRPSPYLFVNSFTSKQMSSISLGLGLNTKLKKGKHSLLDN